MKWNSKPAENQYRQIYTPPNMTFRLMRKISSTRARQIETRLLISPSVLETLARTGKKTTNPLLGPTLQRVYDAGQLSKLINLAHNGNLKNPNPSSRQKKTTPIARALETLTHTLGNIERTEAFLIEFDKVFRSLINVH